MDERELAELFLEYLDENDLYSNFLQWAEENNYDPNELDSDITITLPV